jgi:hypothetical protein
MLHIRNRLKHGAIAVAALALSATSAAAPFAIQYIGTTANSTFPEIVNGLEYTVTLTVDNGGATAASQTWTASDLRCVVFQMNLAGGAGGGGPASFTQDLAASNATLNVVGSMTTDAGGALTSLFSDIETNATPPAGTYSFAGFAPVPDIAWFLDSLNQVFFDHDQSSPPTRRQWGDSSGLGVRMAAGLWSSPRASGACPIAPPPGPTTTAVPTLTQWMTVLLAVLLAIGGLAIVHRR